MQIFRSLNIRNYNFDNVKLLAKGTRDSLSLSGQRFQY